MVRVSGNLAVARAMASTRLSEYPETTPPPTQTQTLTGDTRPLQCPEKRGHSGAVRNAATHRAKGETRPPLPRRNRPVRVTREGDLEGGCLDYLEDKTIVNFLEPVHTSQVSPVDKTIVNFFDPVHISQVSPEDRTTVNSFDSVQLSQGESTSADSVQAGRRDNTMVNACGFVQVDLLDWQAICFGVRGCRWADIVDSEETECVEATMQVFVKQINPQHCHR